MSSVIEICGRRVSIEGRLVRVAKLQAEKYVAVNDPPGLLEGLRKCGARVDLFTFIQKLPETAPKYFYPMEWDNLAVLPVETFEHWWNEQIGFKARNKARQAEKKRIVLREVPFDDALVRGIHEVYNECPVRQGMPNIHFGKDIETVRRLEATFLDRSMFIGAFLSDHMIGFVKLTWDETQTAAHLVNIVSMVRHRDKCPTNALIARAVGACAERKIPYLVYAKFAYGKKERDGLSDFKERNGFQRVDLPRYYVPLTRLGRTALRLRLHHRLTERIPETVAARLRRLRAAWYNRKLRGAVEIS